MRLYPIFLDLHDARALVLGDGEVAHRKAEPLRQAGAEVRLRPRFDAQDLAGCAIAIGADAPEADLRALAAEARARGIPVNIVDRPELGTWMAPALIDRDPITVAISTSGTAPVLARLLRQRIEASLAPSLGALARLADTFSAELRERLPDPADRRPRLEAALTGAAVDLLAAGQHEAARQAFAAALQATPTGLVSLVGAGPGEADLLTLRAHRRLGGAELIVHDADVGPALLDMARRDAARRAAGPDTLGVLADLACAGRRAVWLRLGTGETLLGEMARLEALGVPVEFVPGPPPPATFVAVSR